MIPCFRHLLTCRMRNGRRALRAGHSAHPSGPIGISLLISGATRLSLKIEIYFLLAIVMMGHHFPLKLGTMWIYKCCSCSLQVEERVLKV